MRKIKVIVADDHPILRSGLKTLFNAQPDIEVVAEAADGDETVQKSRQFIPDIVVLDISMPGLNTFEVTKEIKRLNPATKVLVLTMHEDENYPYQMMRAGADSYVTKKAADTELLDAVRATYRGEHFVHASMTKGLVRELRSKKVLSLKAGQDSKVLSEREREVLGLLALGHTDQEIADKLYLGVKTVETYKARLKEKLGLKGRAELVRYAIRAGLVNTED